MRYSAVVEYSTQIQILIEHSNVVIDLDKLNAIFESGDKQISIHLKTEFSCWKILWKQ